MHNEPALGTQLPEVSKHPYALPHSPLNRVHVRTAGFFFFLALFGGRKDEALAVFATLAFGALSALAAPLAEPALVERQVDVGAAAGAQVGIAAIISATTSALAPAVAELRACPPPPLRAIRVLTRGLQTCSRR